MTTYTPDWKPQLTAGTTTASKARCLIPQRRRIRRHRARHARPDGAISQLHDREGSNELV